jgi:hypothetical protein
MSDGRAAAGLAPRLKSETRSVLPAVAAGDRLLAVPTENTRVVLM